jgi:hypothetical protein
MLRNLRAVRQSTPARLAISRVLKGVFEVSNTPINLFITSPKLRFGMVPFFPQVMDIYVEEKVRAKPL